VSSSPSCCSYHSLFDIGPPRSIHPKLRALSRKMSNECPNKYGLHQMRKRLGHFGGYKEVLRSIDEAGNGIFRRLRRREITQSIDHFFDDDDDSPHIGRYHNRGYAEPHPHHFESLVDEYLHNQFGQHKQTRTAAAKQCPV